VLGSEEDVHQRGSDGKDEGYSKGQGRAVLEGCGVCHVPESKLKTAEGAVGQAGKEADDQSFHEDCVMPRAKRVYREHPDPWLALAENTSDLPTSRGPENSPCQALRY